MQKEQRKEKRSILKFNNVLCTMLMAITVIPLTGMARASTIEVQTSTEYNKENHESENPNLELEKNNEEQTNFIAGEEDTEGIEPSNQEDDTPSFDSESEAIETEQGLTMEEVANSEVELDNQEEKTQEQNVISEDEEVEPKEPTEEMQNAEGEFNNQGAETQGSELELEVEQEEMVEWKGPEVHEKPETLLLELGVIGIDIQRIKERIMCKKYVEQLLSENVITEQEAEIMVSRGNNPENPWMNFTEEDVMYLGDAMDAEVCVLLSKSNQGKRAFFLTGSALINRLRNTDWGNKTTVKDVIFSVVSGRRQYGARTRRLVGRGECKKHGHEFVYDWARELLTYGPIAVSNRLVYQGDKKQGKVYDQIANEYFGEY